MSELKCIYWKNATPDDFINARLGETWIQGVGEVDTFYAEDLVHNFGKAWKEKLTLALVEVERLKAGRYRMMIPVEISTTGGLLLDRRDGIHGYSLEDYPNARFFKGW